MAAARCCLRVGGLWIVGLLHAPSLSFHRLRLMSMRDCEGLPVHARLGVGSTNGSALLIFASPSETESGLRCPCTSGCACALVLRPGCWRPSGVRTPLMGLSEICPSIDLGTRCPLPVVPLLRRAAARLHLERFRLAARSHLRPGAATSRTCSALAVPPGFDGLLHLVLCRFVAPCCRSWGSPRFRSVGSWCETCPAVARRGGDVWARRPGAVRSLSEEASSSRPFCFLLRCRRDPGGSCPLSRRGSLSVPLDLSQWRSTLRSFPLVSSCAASTEPFCRTPGALPSPGGPGFGVVPGA
jgi:hypothetical protein